MAEVNGTRMLRKGGRFVNQKGEANNMAKLTPEQVIEIQRRRAAGEKLIVIALDFPVTEKAISKIGRGINWT